MFLADGLKKPEKPEKRKPEYSPKSSTEKLFWNLGTNFTAVGLRSNQRSRRESCGWLLRP